MIWLFWFYAAIPIFLFGVVAFLYLKGCDEMRHIDYVGADNLRLRY